MLRSTTGTGPLSVKSFFLLLIHLSTLSQPHKSMDSTQASSDSSMQIDELDYHANPCESMIASPTPLPRQARFSIPPEEDIEFMNKRLEYLVRPDDDDDKILSRLDFVRRAVHRTLSDDLEVIERLASWDEFLANVEREGEKKVIELLRNTAKGGSWSDLFESCTTCLTLLA